MGKLKGEEERNKKKEIRFIIEIEELEKRCCEAQFDQLLQREF